MSGAKKIIKLLKKLSLLIDIRSGIKYSKNSLSLWNYRYYIQTILKFFIEIFIELSNIHRNVNRNILNKFICFHVNFLTKGDNNM